ncbi:MAG: hypothetical protein IIB13_04025 [Chloroflexi bacterium]|jgi:hypothetical protein|nr:hypothetical protein [Chloroflexota bacterium]
MVKEVDKKGKTAFACEECGYVYEEKEWAEKCQTWCSEKQSCNLEITEHGAPPE